MLPVFGLANWMPTPVCATPFTGGARTTLTVRISAERSGAPGAGAGAVAGCELT